MPTFCDEGEAAVERPLMSQPDRQMDSGCREKVPEKTVESAVPARAGVL